MSFNTEIVTARVNNIMKALDIDKTRGTAPPGASEDTLAKFLQALNIQKATKKHHKKKKNDSNQASSSQKDDAKSEEENVWAGLGD